MSTGVQGLEGQKRLDVVRGSACRGEGLGRPSKVAILRQGDDAAGVVLRLAPGRLGAALAGDFLPEGKEVALLPLGNPTAHHLNRILVVLLLLVPAEPAVTPTWTSGAEAALGHHEEPCPSVLAPDVCRQVGELIPQCLTPQPSSFGWDVLNRREVETEHLLKGGERRVGSGNRVPGGGCQAGRWGEARGGGGWRW